MSKITCFNNTGLEEIFNNNKSTEQFEENAAVKTIKAEYDSILAELNAIKEELEIPTEESKITTSEIKFQIIGEKGASKVEQYQQSLNQAKALDKQGAYTSEIEKQTGWYKNQQNQWKKFSDDYVEQLAFKPNYLENINKEVLISDVLEDNIILQAYPEIKNQKVIFYDETYKNIPEQAVGTNGFLRIEERGGVSTLFIKTGEGRGEMDKNTFSHELNHYIQRVEGFAKGGNEQTTILLAMSVGRVRKGYGGIKKQFLDSLKRTDLTKEDRKIIEEGIKYLNSANKDEFAFAQYQRLQGEIDSRAVENAVKFNKLGKTYSEIVDDILRKDSINEEDIINIFGIERLLESRPAQKENNTQEVIDRLKQTGLAENIYQLTTEEINVKLKELGQDDIDNLTGGFVYGKDVYLNSSLANNSTVLHEFQHLFSAWIKVNRPELYNRGVNLAKAELTKENSEIKDVIDYVKTTQPNLTEEALLEEIVAELTGRKGVELLESGKKSSIVDWLKEFWSEVKNMLGILEATPEQVANMTLGDFAKASATQLLSGKIIEPSATFNSFNTYTEAVKNTPINEIIKIDI